MSKFTISPGPDGPEISYGGADLAISKETTAITDDNDRWTAPPLNHLITIRWSRTAGDSAHWLFRVAVSSLDWRNAGDQAPRGQFVIDRPLGVDEREKIVELSARGLLVTGFSFAWSAETHTITEVLSLQALQLNRIRSDLHPEVAQSELVNLEE
jgi:hypothetical protein